ncbi:uncharacterized protein Z518_04604 [Rhinocladiella mackenziei CBS 650.93]|uniref:Rhinocladiella mackenziei CBS 650.93 unplaced genomic scaffold supercont1.3, whole genome shotgun sequence n=1 Tax=Rhinocladiella mackenziei CBS 650.93 TaxID=1442369 RepID=A0A0D2H877_9EURO|nr:uncharacterized protein Z518_04604 [Rhinocladiella mackenziei CBS 650.93]KIX06628.1 hypothetical protein Z518_04604 [Rhinocladiella mackenziei CBS 650.93]
MSDKTEEACATTVETAQPQPNHARRGAHIDDEGALVTDEAGYVTEADALPRSYYRSKFFIGTFAALGTGLMAGTGAFGYSAPILTTINQDIGPDPNYIWISYVYNTCLAVTLPVLGQLSDIFGRRYFYIGGAGLGIVGSIVCSQAHNIPVLIGGNVLLGIASATQLSYHYVLGELLPTKYRYFGVGTLYMCSYAGSGFSPAIANAFILGYPNVGWRGIYYLLFALNATSCALWTTFYFPPNFRQKHGRGSKLYWIKHFDYLGLFLLVGGFVVFLFGISVGGTQYPWNSAPPIVMILLGFLTLVALGLWSVYFPKRESVIPYQHFTNFGWLACVMVGGFAATVYYAGAILWPMQVYSLYAEGDLTYGGYLSSMPGLGQITGGVVFGWLVQKIGWQKYQVVGSFFAGSAFTTSLAAVTLNNKVAMAVCVFVGNLFLGWAEIVCLLNATILIKDQREIGSAGGLAVAIRTAISAIGTVVFSTVLTNRLTSTVPNMVGPAVVDAGLPQSSVPAFLQALQVGTAEAFSKVPGVTQSIIADGVLANKEAYVASFRTVYLVSITFAGLGVILSLFTPNMKWYLNDKVASVLQADQLGKVDVETAPIGGVNGRTEEPSKHEQ